MDFLAVDTIQGGTSDPPSVTPPQASPNRVNMGDSWQELPINYPQQPQIKPKSKGGGRLKLALIVGCSLVIGIAVANVGGLKPYSVGSGENSPQPQPTSTPTPDSQVAPTPEPTPVFTEGENPDKQMRDIYLNKSLESINVQRDRLDESAADGVINDARAENKTKGTPYEVYLFRRINVAVAEGRLMVGKGVDLTSGEGIRQGWIWMGQSKALLIAWQRVNTQNAALLTEGKVTPQYTATANIAVVLSNLVVAVQSGAVARQADFENILRIEYMKQQEIKKQEELLKLQKKMELESAKQAKGGKNAKQ